MDVYLREVGNAGAGRIPLWRKTVKREYKTFTNAVHGDGDPSRVGGVQYAP